MDDYLDVSHPVTGEVVGKAVAPKPRGRGPSFGKGGWWMTGVDPVMGAFGQFVGGVEPRVFIALMASMGERNMIHKTQSEIASMARVSEGAVSVALTRMEKLGIVRRVARGTMQFSPCIAWRGKTQEHAMYINRWLGAHRQQREAYAQQRAPDPGETEDGV